MDWGDIGNLIKGVAPTLATALGGPLAGAAAKIVADALGLGSDATPGDIAGAIQKGGADVTAALQSAEQTAAARWAYLTAAVQADAQQGQAINETMRAEIASGVSWWHWRHLMGYCLLPWMLVPLPLMTWALYRGDATTVQSIVALATALLPFFTIIAALLGYVAGDTTRRITTAMVGDHAPTILGSIAKAIGKK